MNCALQCSVVKNISAQPLRFRPRERLLSLGAKALPTEEIVAILLGSGTKKRPLHIFAQHITTLVQQHIPSTVTYDQLHGGLGLGHAKTCVILAAFELSARFQEGQDLKLTSPGAIAMYLQELHTAQKEMVIGLYFNARFTLEHKEVLAIGSMNQAMLQPRDVFAPIKMRPIASIVIAHNHPSGTVEPSEEDIVFTKRMKEAAALIGVTFLDHIIVTRTGNYSMKEHGFL